MEKTIKPTPILLAHPSVFTAMEIDYYENAILANPKATERLVYYEPTIIMGSGLQSGKAQS